MGRSASLAREFIRGLYNLPMTRTQLLISATAFLFAAATVAAKVDVQLTDSKGKSVGTAILSDKGKKGVGVDLKLENMPPGEHGVHFHREAKCDAPDFKSAGPHFNPDLKQHGLENPAGHHNGDNQNITVDANGKAKAHWVNKDLSLGENIRSLFSNGGTSLVIHAGPDDQKTDPAGNSGDRIACGVITHANERR
jgi:Cu-Zn family superoxide dismutase